MKDKKKVAKLLAALKAEMTTEEELKIIENFSTLLNTTCNEEWRNIEGYEGHYQVSNIGRVRSNYSGEWRLMKQQIPTSPSRRLKDRYFKVTLQIKGKSPKNCYSHILVAQAFVPNPENKPTVDHIDGDKLNNCACNLKWATPKEQTETAIRLGKFKPREVNNKLNKEAVKYIRKHYKFRDKNFSAVALSKKFGVSKMVILRIVRNETYRHIK